MKNRLIFLLIFAAIFICGCQSKADPAVTLLNKSDDNSDYQNHGYTRGHSSRLPLNAQTSTKPSSILPPITTVKTHPTIIQRSSTKAILKHQTTTSDNVIPENHISTTHGAPVTTTAAAVTSDTSVPNVDVVKTSVSTLLPKSTPNAITSTKSSTSNATTTTPDTQNLTNDRKLELNWYPPKNAQNDMEAIDFIAAIGALFWITIITVGFFRRDMFFDTWLRRFHSESVTISENEEAPLLKKSSSLRPPPISSRRDSAAPDSSQRSSTLLKSLSKQT